MTYQEMHELTGEAERIVHFTLPPGSSEVLRLIPGFETFDERTEVLKCVKPGTGTKDAPRAFSLKLASVTRSQVCKMVPTTIDPELEVRHDHGNLTAMLAKHVDDIKVCGEKPIVAGLVSELERVFGKLSVSHCPFTNCGVQHVRHPDGAVELDQDAYISALIPIQHHSLVGAPSDSPVSAEVVSLFWSLLGALAYSLLTQHWLAVYVVALQRVTHSPLAIHVRRLNALVRIAQKQKAHI